MAVFGCEMFNRQNEWFLTFEHAMNLSVDQRDMAMDIADFVITWILSWHNEHPNSNVDIPEAHGDDGPSSAYTDLMSEGNNPPNLSIYRR
jgi:hypothetical protein